MKLLVGLGNPGPDYAQTRHNLGFLLTEFLAREDDLATAGTGERARHTQATAGAQAPSLFLPAQALAPEVALRGFSFRHLLGKDLLLIRPERFMNRSGESLVPLCAHLGLDLAMDPLPLMVAYDDLDLDVGALKLKPFGGHGGHNGMRSILSSLGTDRFPRLRIGIGRGATDAARHVLSEFTPSERIEIDIAIREAAEAVLAWAGGLDIDKCMTRFHSRWTPGR